MDQQDREVGSEDGRTSAAPEDELPRRRVAAGSHHHQIGLTCPRGREQNVGNRAAIPGRDLGTRIDCCPLGCRPPVVETSIPAFASAGRADPDNRELRIEGGIFSLI
jgi:hypothetical protein